MAILLRSVRRDGEAITAALDEAGVPFVVTGMDNLFETAEAEAARQLFYFLASEIDEAALRAAWEQPTWASRRVRWTAAVALPPVGPERHEEGRRRAVQGLQPAAPVHGVPRGRGLARGAGAGGRGEVVFYNLGKFSQVISDFESIHFHSKPVEKYESFADFLRYHAENAYPEGWQDNAFASPDAVRIMTVHQAKGLQWPVVFVPQLVRNRFPSRAGGGRTAWHLIPDAAFDNAARYRGSLRTNGACSTWP